MSGDGGPAFPSSTSHTLKLRAGMTLRDHFAGKALAAVLSNKFMLDAMLKAVEVTGTPLEPGAAKMAYNFADAMIAERDK